MENHSIENRTTNMNDTKAPLTHTKTQFVRQSLHPLEVNDKLAFEKIKTVRLDFLTDEAVPPIPRCQALPSHAFSRLTGRSILVALSCISKNQERLYSFKILARLLVETQILWKLSKIFQWKHCRFSISWIDTSNQFWIQDERVSNRENQN